MKSTGSCSSAIRLKAQIFIWTGQFDFNLKIDDIPQHENIPFTCSSGIQESPSLSGRRWKTSSTLNKPFLPGSTLQTFLSTKVKSNT